MRKLWLLIAAALVLSSFALAQTPHGANIAWTNSTTAGVTGSNVYRCAGTLAACGSTLTGYTKIAASPHRARPTAIPRRTRTGQRRGVRWCICSRRSVRQAVHLVREKAHPQRQWPSPSL